MAGTVTITYDEIGVVRRCIATCTADASDGSFPNTDVRLDGRLFVLRTNPGATAPTANYDITLVDEHGLDRLQGVGANRHTSTSEEVSVVYSGTAIHPVCAAGEVLSLRIANNSVNSATTEIVLGYGPI